MTVPLPATRFNAASGVSLLPSAPLKITGPMPAFSVRFCAPPTVPREIAPFAECVSIVASPTSVVAPETMKLCAVIAAPSVAETVSTAPKVAFEALDIRTPPMGSARLPMLPVVTVLGPAVSRTPSMPAVVGLILPLTMIGAPAPEPKEFDSTTVPAPPVAMMAPVTVIAPALPVIGELPVGFGSAKPPRESNVTGRSAAGSAGSA